MRARATAQAALFALVCVAPTVLHACAGPTREALTARTLPDERAERDQLLSVFGRRLYGALQTGELNRVVVDGRGREELLRPASAHSTERGRTTEGAAIAPAERALWSSGTYAGLCIQSGRLELPFGVVGLRTQGFVFERGLLIGREPGGGQLAGWLEGVFVLTRTGFVALSIERVEPPRRDHADLELAECELADRQVAPLPVVSSGELHH